MVWLLRRFRRVLVWQPQPRHHGWTWRRTRKRQLRLTVWTSLLRFPLAACFKSTPSFFFDKIDEGREERKFREDGGDTVLLVRGLQGNTMVAQCGSGWTARDLSASLRCRTSVPVHLFYLVLEERMIDDDELVRSLGRDRVVSMRGRVLGGSRNFSPIPGEWTCPGCMRSGCWPTRTRAFVVGRRVPIPLCPPWPVLNNSRTARAPREQRHPGRVPGNSASGCPTERRTPPASSFFYSVSSFGARGGRVESRHGCSVLAWFECAACGVGGDPKCGSSSCS